MKQNTQLKKTCTAVAACLAFRAAVAVGKSEHRLKSSWLDVTSTSLVLNLHRRTLRKMQIRGELIGKKEQGTVCYRALEIVRIMDNR
jgi:hypothetical protein